MDPDDAKRAEEARQNRLLAGFLGGTALLLGALLLISGWSSSSASRYAFLTCGALMTCAGVYGVTWSRSASRRSRERAARLVEALPAAYVSGGGPEDPCVAAFWPALAAHAQRRGARLERAVPTSAGARPIDLLLVQGHDHYCFVFLPEVPGEHLEALVAVLQAEHRRLVNARYNVPKALRLSAPAIVSVLVLPGVPEGLGEVLARSADTMTGGESCLVHLWDRRRPAWYHPPERRTAADLPGAGTTRIAFDTVDPVNRTLADLGPLWESFQSVTVSGATQGGIT